MLPTTLEWHVAAGLAALAALAWPLAGAAAAAMLMLSLLVAALQATQARLAPAHDGLRARLVVMALCYLQPLVRSLVRYRTRLFAYRLPAGDTSLLPRAGMRLPWTGTHTAAYWSENGMERLQLLGCVILYLNEHRWGRAIDSGWSDWDLAIYCHPWTVVQVSTAQENHGGTKRLIRLRYRLRPSGYLHALAGLALLGGAAAACLWPLAALGGTMALLVACLELWRRGTCRAAQVLALFDRWAQDLAMVRCGAAASVYDHHKAEDSNEVEW
jgi:hypothetical protein